MSGYQRMIAIPQEEYAQLTVVQNARQPLTQHMYNLERQYNEESKIIDPYAKLALQSNTLDDMKRLKDQMRQQLQITTPKPYLNRAQALFNSLEAFLKYNERGEIYGSDGQLISNSRLEDLIQFAVRDRRREIIPTGWKPFLDIMRVMNIPKSILNRNTLDELENPMQVNESKKTTPKKKLGTTPSRLPRAVTVPKISKRIRKSSTRYPSEDFLKHF